MSVNRNTHTPRYTALYGVALVNDVSIPTIHYNRLVGSSRRLSSGERSESLTGHLAVQRCAKRVGIQINWYLATNTYRYPFILSYTLLRTILNKATLRVYYHQFNGYTIRLTR